MILNCKSSLKLLARKFFPTAYDSYYVYIDKGSYSAGDYYFRMKKDRRFSTILIGDSNQDAGVHFFIQTSLPTRKSEVRSIMFDYVQYWQFDVEPCTKNKLKFVFANSKGDCYATANFKLMESYPRELYVLTYINPIPGDYGIDIHRKLTNNSMIRELWVRRSAVSDYKYIKMYFSLNTVLSHSAVVSIMKAYLGDSAMFSVEPIDKYPVLNFEGCMFSHNLYEHVHGVEGDDNYGEDDGCYISEGELSDDEGSTDAACGDESEQEPFGQQIV